jgi:prepilin-type N-terminal cleavage/methylation domain-containing protein
MRITGTGKATSGYTLLEVLAVLLLIGLISVLVQPEMFLSVERNRLRYVGKLVQADFDRVRAEAKTNSEIKVAFNSTGYSFTIGSTVITRNFKLDGVQFQIHNGTDGATAPEVCFSSNGANPATTLTWKSQHYQGTLAISETGAVQWSDHVK